jgi:hypothetical protein
VTSVDRTAYPGFARVVSARELAEAFTPTEAELEWARGRTQDENHLLALVVWLKSYQRLGYFPKVEDVPTVVVGHVGDALELGDDVELERAAVRSAKRHREFVRRRLGVVYDAARVRQIAEEAIRKTAQSKDDPADLINVALEELIRLRCELPGYTTLDAMAASIRTEVNTVGGALDQAVQQAEHRAGEQARAPAVDDLGVVAVVVGEDPDGHRQTDHAQDQVDQEDRAPGEAEQVGADVEAGQYRAADGWPLPAAGRTGRTPWSASPARTSSS